MAQGLLKKSASKPAVANSAITKKGARTFAPKKAKLAKQAKLNKKFTAGLTAQTEKMLGERAGHLEMLSGGRKKSTPAGAKATGKSVAKGKKA